MSGTALLGEGSIHCNSAGTWLEFASNANDFDRFILYCSVCVHAYFLSKLTMGITAGLTDWLILMACQPDLAYVVLLFLKSIFPNGTIEYE